MMSRHGTRGKCIFCQNDYTRTGMTRHLETCKTRKAAIAAASAPGIRLFHLTVQGAYNAAYWMNLEIPASATLQDLDSFLRDTWVECCGHLSSFEIIGSTYMSLVDLDWGDGLDMNHELGQLLTPGLRFAYQYDFGSTTLLALRSVSERQGVASKASKGKLVQVLARNDPPAHQCEACGKPATLVCTYCRDAPLCDECAETHACGDEGLLPVVNSPRMGTCGYTGNAR